MENQGDKLLSVNIVAEACGVTPKTIRVWIREGRIPASRMGPHSIRVRESDLKAFLERAQVQTQK